MVILITGASAGIGAATALKLASNGHHVALVARSSDKIIALADQIKASGGTAIPIELDLGDLDATRIACTQIADKLGPINALVNSAATIEPIGSFATISAEEFAACMQTNLIGAWNLIATVLPAMANAGSGVVVNLSSGAASTPMEGWSAYCSSKAGLQMLTRMIDHEYRAKGVFAYGFRPGLVATTMQASIRASGINPISKLPEADLAPPEHAANAIAWLVEKCPEHWCGENEPDIRDPLFIKQAGL